TTHTCTVLVWPSPIMAAPRTALRRCLPEISSPARTSSSAAETAARTTAPTPAASSRTLPAIRRAPTASRSAGRPGSTSLRGHRQRSSIANRGQSKWGPLTVVHSTVAVPVRGDPELNAKTAAIRPPFEQVTVIGGADEDRTHDLLNAIQALSQTELRPHGLKQERQRSVGSKIPRPSAAHSTTMVG